jgi:hypothetical protein
MKILQSTLQNIHKLIVSIRIGRHQKKPRIKHKILGIADNPFNHLAVVEVDPHPQPRNGRRMFMKMKGPMTQVPIECLYEEDRLGVLCRNFLDRLGVQKSKSNRFKRILTIIPQKLFHRPKLTDLNKTPDRMIFIPNYDPMGVPRLPTSRLPYA